MTNEIDAAVLALLGDPVADHENTYFRESVGVTVYDGWFKLPAGAEVETGKRVTYPLPYANYMSSFGDEDSPRLCGRTAQTEEFFRLFVVGLSREQVKWAVGRLRSLLSGTRLTGVNVKPSLIKVDSAPLMTRDDGATRPDGRPLFTAIDNYTLRTSIRRS